jgi:hypothetical protein
MNTWQISICKGVEYLNKDSRQLTIHVDGIWLLLNQSTISPIQTSAATHCEEQVIVLIFSVSGVYKKCLA